MRIVNQDGNTVSGNLVAGDSHETNYNWHVSGTSAELTLLYDKLRKGGDSSNGAFCEQLEHYLAAKTDGDVRGLTIKLTDSDRTDQIPIATELKEKATKAILRHQSSKTAQRVYTIILDELHTNFLLTVTPAIQADAGRREVDLCISQALHQTKSILGENVLEITLKDLLGLLFFLGGNCHIRWDKC